VVIFSPIGKGRALVEKGRVSELANQRIGKSANQQDGAWVLPDGWVWATLEEVCLAPQYGWTTKALAEGNLRLLRTTDITSGSIDWKSVPFCRDEPPEVEKYLLHDGDIVISRAGSVGYSHRVRNPGRAVFASYLIRFKPMINGQYVAYFLQSPSYWDSVYEERLGIAVPNINATKLKRIALPLAPLPEQRRIVAAIETQFTRLDAGVAALERARANLRRYRAAVLKAACEGRLVPTEAELARAEGRDYEPAVQLLDRILAKRRAKWEAEHPGRDYKEPAPPDTEDLPKLPGGWHWASTEQVGSVIGGLTKNSKRKAYPLRLPYLRVANVYADELRLDDMLEIGVKESELARVLLHKGDLLVVEGNGSIDQIGRVAIWNGSIEPCVHQNHIIKVRFPFVEVGKFVLLWLLSLGGRDQIIRVASSTSGLYTLSLSKVSMLPVPLPPLAEQRRIVAEVERRLSVVEALEQEVEAALTRAQRLRQAVLKKAFEGRLVEQDPDDEPASALLERIRVAREARAAGGKKRKTRQMRLPEM